MYYILFVLFFFFFFQAEDGIRDLYVTGVQTCALPICVARAAPAPPLGNHDEPRGEQLDRDDRERHGPVRPVGEPVRVPRRPGRERLSPEVVVEGGEVQPRRVAARELRDA